MNPICFTNILVLSSFFQFTEREEFKDNRRTAQPNLLVIQTDEHSFRTLGCYRRHLSPDQAHVWGYGRNYRNMQKSTPIHF